MVIALTNGEVNTYSFLSMSAVLPVTSDFSSSTDSDQKAPSLPIVTSPEVSPVGSFLPSVKNKENLRLDRKKNRFVIWVACVAGVWKGREEKGSFRRERNARAGAREEGRKETPVRKPLYSPSSLLIIYAKTTQLWMTSCQSLAAIYLKSSVNLYKRTLVAGKEELNFEDLQESCNQLLRQVPGGFITSIISKTKNRLQQSGRW